MSDPNKCSMEDCHKELGPDALTFEHNGESAGGICNLCLGDAVGVRVLFKKNDEETYLPLEIAHLDKII